MELTNYSYLCLSKHIIMNYTLTIDNENIQAESLINFLKTLDFVKLTKEKSSKAKKKTAPIETHFSQEILEAAQVLEMTPTEIVKAAEKYEMTPDDYAFTMVLSKEINGNISQRLIEKFNL